jgi:mannose-6-phosphate isomerase
MMLPKFVFQAKENLVKKSWGGDWIPLIKGFKQDEIGESWEFSAIPENPSEVVVGGAMMSLPELFARAKNDILGIKADKYDYFPLLVKLIDVKGESDTVVSTSEKIWVVLSRGAIHAGLIEEDKEENEEEKEKSEKEAGEFKERLYKYEALPREMFLIPPGVPHSAENVRLLEVSSTNASVLRHGDEDFEKLMSDSKVTKAIGRIEGENFGVEILEISGTRTVETGGTFNIIVSIEGYSILRSENEVADLHKGYSCLIPSTTDKFEIQSERAVVVRVYPK